MALRGNAGQRLSSRTRPGRSLLRGPAAPRPLAGSWRWSDTQSCVARGNGARATLPGMSGDDGKRSGELLGWIAAAGAILSLLTVVVIVISQAFGFATGSPSDASIVSLLTFALIALGLLPAAAWFRRQ